MSHARQQIIEAIYNTLLDLPTTGNRVVMHRVYPLDIYGLPGLSVHFVSDARTRPSSLSLREGHTMTVHVVIHVKPTDDTPPDELANQISVEVEEALYANTTLGGLCRFLACESTSAERSGSEERKVARYTQTWACQYEIAANNPDVPL